MNTINCPECGHSIARHTRSGCWGADIYHTCKARDCKQTPESIAAHAVEQAIAEAMEVIKPFAKEGESWSGNQNMALDGDIPTIKWRGDLFASNAVFTVGDLRRASAYLAAHQPQERTEAEPEIVDGTSSPEWWDAQKEVKP